MRKALLVGWMCLPVAAWAYHQGPGQEQLQLDKADSALIDAALELQSGKHNTAILRYEDALKELPEDRVAEARKIRLAMNVLRTEDGQLVTAREELRALVEEMSKDEDADQDVLREARHAYGNSQYYITYLMRLENYTREEWEPEIEIARQTFRLLAEDADREGDATLAQTYREDLESTVRLARLDLQDLQALPLPNQ